MLRHIEFHLMNKTHYKPKKLADVRKTIGTQKKVAGLVGVTITQLSRAENGKSASFELIDAIARLGKVKTSEILNN
jgi:transcriptional regulator with XRE-family HTH domain